MRMRTRKIRRETNFQIVLCPNKECNRRGSRILCSHAIPHLRSSFCSNKCFSFGLWQCDFYEVKQKRLLRGE